MLAAYNAGEGAVAKYGGTVPPYPETQAYVRDVLAVYRRLTLDFLGQRQRRAGGTWREKIMSMTAYFKSAAVSHEGVFSRYSDLVLVAGIIAIVAMMVLPLPLWLIDLLVAANIASGIVLLLLGVYIASPLEFSVFPSVLLMTTLFRLSLSIATTRMILLHGDAGHIIDTFGKVVAGGNLVVGLVVFLIITVVQFIVIAKGAERVAEVAARFSLDAMPGKQLSIDSDLRSGLIDKDEAKRKRRNLEMESKLHGSLDGAMKFVKGDAIAGIVIIVINLLGGLAIGVMMHGDGRRHGDHQVLDPDDRRRHGRADPGAAGRDGRRPDRHPHQRRGRQAPGRLDPQAARSPSRVCCWSAAASAC